MASKATLFMILAMMATACHYDAAHEHGGVDASPRPPPDASDMCCEIEVPSCNCFVYGGTRDMTQADPAYQCVAICDAEPDGWVEDVDNNGCPVLRWVGGTGSCFGIPDARLPDASYPDYPDAGPSAADDAGPA